MVYSQKLFIDPANLTLPNASELKSYCALLRFLDKTDVSTVWHSNRDYGYTHNDINYQFSFAQSIIKRPRKEGKSGFKFHLFDPGQLPKGKGGYAVVYPIGATFYCNNQEQVIVKPGKRKLVKIQEHTPRDGLDADKADPVVLEYNNLLQAGHLHVKRPVISKNDQVEKSYLIMEDVEGFTLEQILNPEKRLKIVNEVPKLTVYKRLQLTLALLEAIKSQVIDRNLLHRDIKPGNIIVNLNQNPPWVKLIDFGFAIDQQKQDYRRLGTRAYRSPESFNNRPEYTTKSDIYSTGRLLSYLWGDDFINYYISRSKGFNYIKTKSTNKNLFSLPEIDLFLVDVDKNRIRRILNRMIEEDPEERPGIDELIEQFSKINMEQYRILDDEKHSKEYLKEFELKLSSQLLLVKQHLKVMKKKQKDLTERGHKDAADVMDKLIIKIKKNTLLLQDNPNPEYMLRYRKSCLDEINTAQNVLKNHRDLYWIVAEIASAIALLGVGYLFALGVNYYQSGRVGLFSQTKSDKLAESMKDIISIDFNGSQALGR